jgi:hypothetical protein
MFLIFKSNVRFGFGVITFFPHQLPAIVNMLPVAQTDILTKREYEIVIFILLPHSVRESR